MYVHFMNFSLSNTTTEYCLHQYMLIFNIMGVGIVVVK